MRRYVIELAEDDTGYAVTMYWDTEIHGQEARSLRVFQVAEELLLWLHEELIGTPSPDAIKTTIRITKKGVAAGGVR